MTFMEQVFALFAVLTILGASLTFWRTRRCRERFGAGFACSFRNPTSEFPAVRQVSPID